MACFGNLSQKRQGGSLSIISHESHRDHRICPKGNGLLDAANLTVVIERRIERSARTSDANNQSASAGIHAGAVARGSGVEDYSVGPASHYLGHDILH